jgi:hypothetical protein
MRANVIMLDEGETSVWAYRLLYFHDICPILPVRAMVKCLLLVGLCCITTVPPFAVPVLPKDTLGVVAVVLKEILG